MYTYCVKELHKLGEVVPPEGTGDLWDTIDTNNAQYRLEHTCVYVCTTGCGFRRIWTALATHTYPKVLVQTIVF